MKIMLLFSLILTLFLTFVTGYNGVGKTPPMGWNSWNHFGCNINEDLIKQTADNLISLGLFDLGYRYINLDDCWQVSRDENDVIVADPEKFPSGIKALADYMHSKGLKLGIYSDAGEKTCAGRPGSLNHEEIDAKTYAEWGIDYLKYDNCFNDGISSKIRYPAMRDALNKAGREIFFSMCQWGEERVATWAGDIANSWRTTPDIKDNWISFILILDLQHGLEKYSGPGKWNDPDMLEVGNGGMTLTEYKAHFALWCLLKAPLLLGNDLSNISKEVMDIIGNERLIEVNQDNLGKQGKRIRRTLFEEENGIFSFLEIYTGEVYNGTVVILFNRSKSTKKMTFTLKEIGIEALGANMQNLYTGEDYGYVKTEFSSDVESHGVVVIKVHIYCENKNLKFLE